jgi:hypothetical protein
LVVVPMDEFHPYAKSFIQLGFHSVRVHPVRISSS